MSLKKKSVLNTSDSDDDLMFPSVKKFEDIFSQAEKKARADFKPIEVSKTKAAKKSPTEKNKKHRNIVNSSKCDLPTTSKSSNKSGRTTRSKKASEESVVDISADTEDLLAQINKLKHSSKSNSKKEAGINVPNSNHRNTSKSTKVEVEEIVLSDSECDVDLLDISVSNIPEEEIVFCEEVSIRQDTECTVRVRWETEVLRISVLQSAKMSTVRMKLANKLSKRADNVVIIDANNEEVSDNLIVANISFGTVFESFIREEDSVPNKTKKLDPNYVQVKVQGCGGYRERLIVYIQRTTHIKQLIEDYCEKFKKDLKYKLIFDGEKVDLTETPETLDLEGGEMFDIVEI